MSVAYTEGAGPDLMQGESSELFYKIRDVEEIMQRMQVDPMDGESLEAKVVYEYICDLEFDLDLPFHQVLTLAAKSVKTTKLPTKRNLLKQLRIRPPLSRAKLAWFTKSLITKKVRSESGVLVVTVLTSPYPQMEGESNEGDKKPFSCAFDCHYCPNQPGQPRSYLRDEPAVLRANQNGFDPVLQFTDRCATLFENGHEIDKIEILILGGTWSSYPVRYREAFSRDLFYAANTFMCPIARSKMSLEHEMLANETAVGCRIIGLTVETRPDCLDVNELKHLRRIGCTRVQLGLQHTDNKVLKRVNRGHTVEQAMHGIRLLKDSGFKVDAHLMPNLPSSSPEQDREMFTRMRLDPELAVDQIKVYPTAIVPYTKIAKWFQQGKYVPYSLGEMMQVLIEFKTSIPPWIRLNRVVRDIPDMYQDVCGVSDEGHLPTNWRNTLQQEMTNRGVKCQCIRCRECSGSGVDASQARLMVRSYAASQGGTEFFLSFETEQHIFGFCRLRIRGPPCGEAEAFPELANSALVRELHVYGLLVPTGAARTTNTQAQHGGFGKRLLLECERICAQYDVDKLCVISGVGVRAFYKSQGWYALQGEGQFLAKDLARLHRASRRKLTTLLLVASVAVVLKNRL
ncbi:hypothetical protein BASA81_000937 [Batrachochytrium salamandrivorans]|nr:hypothetical protein BASA81_000937 [Batrachochytrium salamandrivorans]